MPSRMYRRRNPPFSPDHYTTYPGAGPDAFSNGGWRPPAGLLLNPAHPSINGLLILCPCNEGNGLTIRNLGPAGPPVISTVNTPTWEANGSGIVCNATSNRYPGTITVPSFSMSEFTLLMAGAFPNSQPGVAGSGGYQALMTVKDAVNNQGLSMYRNGAGPSVGNVAFYGNGGIVGATSLEADSTGALDRVVGVFIITASKKGSYQRIYTQGKQRAANAGYSVTNTCTVIELCNDSVTGTNRTPNCTGMLYAAWSRALGADEIAYISAHPWDLLRAPRKRVYKLGAVGQTISPSGIAPTHAVGHPTLLPAQRLFPTGVAPTHAVGSPAVKGNQFIDLTLRGIRGPRGPGFPTIIGGTPGLYMAIAGANKTSILKVESAQIDRRTGGQSTAIVDLIVNGPGNSPVVGSSFRLMETGRLEFAGEIDEAEEFVYPYTTKHLITCHCVDWNAITLRRLVAVKSYAKGAAIITVIRDILDRAMTGEGVTMVNVDATALGNLTDNLVLDYLKVAEAFNKIAMLTGCVWWIDYNKDLHFINKTDAPVSSVALTPTSNNWANLKVTRTRKDYRNKQYVRSNLNLLVGSVKVTDCWTFIGNRSPDTLCPTTYPITSEPQVRENGITITGTSRLFSVGMFELVVDQYGNIILDTNPSARPAEGWYWTSGGSGVRHWPPYQDAPLNTVLCVDTYGTNTFSQNVAVAVSASEIAARAAIEGGSGIHEEIQEEKNIATYAEALDLANGILLRAGYMPESMRFETLWPNIALMTKMSVVIPEYSLNDYYLVDSMSGHSEAMDLGHGTSFRWQVTLVSKQTLGDYIAWYERLLARTRSIATNSPTEKPTWSLAGDQPNIVNMGLGIGNILGPYIVQRGGIVARITAIFTGAPSSTIVIDILRNGTSIFDGGKLRYDPLSTGSVVTYTNFIKVPYSVTAGDLIQLTVVMVGSTNPGANGTVVMEIV